MISSVDPKWLDAGMNLIQTLVFAVIAVIAWVNSKGKAATAEVKTVDKRRQRDRQELESDIKNNKEELIHRMNTLRADLIERVDTIEVDVRELRTTINHLPDDDDMKELHGRITDMGEKLGTKMGEMSGTLRAVNASQARIQDYLLNQERGGKA